MTPSSYLYDEQDGRYRLYLGEYCTIAGLRLFPDAALVSGVVMYGDAEHTTPHAIGNTTATALISKLSSEYIGLYDFSCNVEPDCKFSTHDDSECHFEATSKNTIHALVDRATPPAYNSQLWDALQTNHGCYITIDEEMQFVTFPNFEALVESQSA